MKTFIISVILFIVMVMIIAINSAYINQTAYQLMQMATALPSPEHPDYYINVINLDCFWKKNYSLISLTVSLNDLNRVTDYISQLIAYSTNSNAQDFEATRKLLVNAIKNLHRLEKISMDSVM